MEEEVITDLGTVLKVIEAMNARFGEVMESICPTNPHRDPYNYYLTGSCVAYAEILHEVFKGYARFCCTKSHAFVRIGNYYVDVTGVYNDAQFKRVEFEEFSLEDEPYFYMATIPFGRNNSEVENKVQAALINIGKEELAKILNTKLQNKNTR